MTTRLPFLHSLIRWLLSDRSQELRRAAIAAVVIASVCLPVIAFLQGKTWHEQRLHDRAIRAVKRAADFMAAGNRDEALSVLAQVMPKSGTKPEVLRALAQAAEIDFPVEALACYRDLEAQMALTPHDEARMAVIRPYGAGTTTRTITIPSVEKCYKVKNDYGGQVLIKTASGVGVTVLPNTQAEIFCNGTECYRAWVSGWGRLSNTAMTSGTSKNISFSVTGQAFARARLTCNFGISMASIVQLTVNGPAGSSSAVNMTASTTAVQGEIMINSLTSDLGAIRNETAVVASSPGLAAATPTTLAFRMVGGITNVTLTSANAFNAGSILVDLE